MHRESVTKRQSEPARPRKRIASKKAARLVLMPLRRTVVRMTTTTMARWT
jgi:hypothetical protein